jgi:hypothetical protein
MSWNWKNPNLKWMGNGGENYYWVPVKTGVKKKNECASYTPEGDALSQFVSTALMELYALSL